MPLFFSHRKKKKKNSSAAFNPNKSLPIANEFGQQGQKDKNTVNSHSKDFNFIDSPLIHKTKRVSLDEKSRNIGNIKMNKPSENSQDRKESLVAYYPNSNNNRSSPSLPEIHSIRSSRKSMDLTQGRSNTSKFSLFTQDPALVRVPMIKLENEDSSSRVIYNSPSESKQAASFSPSLTNAEKLEESTAATNDPNLKKDEPSFLSSFISAAHNAASHISAFTTHEQQLTSHQLAADNKKETENTTTNSSFLQHLDTLLFTKNNSKTPSNELLDVDQNDQESMSERSLIGNVKFQPIRKNAISTMGQGELTLEDLGFSNANSQSVPRNSISTNEEPHSPTSENQQSLPQEDNSLKRSLSPSFFNKSIKNNSLQFADGTDTPPPINSTSTPEVKRNSTMKSLGSALDINKLSKVFSKESINDAASVANSATRSNISRAGLKDVVYASPKKNMEFHQLFKTIPEDERLLEDYSCALQRDILLQGKLYISEKHVCFNSNILGYVTNLIIPLHEVVQLEKKTLAGVFPNAISIQTLHYKYLFASFLSRDSTFDLITNIWNQIIRGAHGMIDDDNLDVNFDFIDRETYNDESEYGESHLSDSDDDGEEGANDSADDSNDEEQANDNDSDDDFDDSIDESEMVKEGGDNGGATADGEKTQDESIGPLKHKPTDPEHELANGETVISEDVINAPLGKVFQILFGDDTSSLKAIVKKQKNYNLSEIPKFTKDGDVKKREYSYTKPLGGPVGPKETLCKVTEIINHQDFRGYVEATQKTKTPDVPSGDSFEVSTSFFLSWGENNTTKVLVVTSIRWTGKSWIKTAVERGTISGQKESIGILLEEVKKMVSSSGQDSGSNSKSSKPIVNLPTVGPAQHPPTENDYVKSSNETQLMDEVFNVPVGTLYSILFGDDTSYFKTILEKQKNFDISAIPPFKSENGVKSRSYSYTKPLNSTFGPKQTRCNITETIEHFDLNKYIQVTQTTSNPDVPYGSSFTVKTKFYLTWAENNATRLFVVTFVNWTGKSVIKGTIEKGSLDGQEEAIGILKTTLNSIIQNAATTPGGKKRKRAKSKSTKSITQTNEPVKQEESTLQMVWGMATSIIPSYVIYGLGAILLVLLLRVIFQPSHKVQIDHVSKIKIDGREYMIVPLVEDQLKSNGAMKQDSEYDVWKWINERSGESKTDTLEYNPNNFEKNFKDQELYEMVKLTEQHLQKLKTQLNKPQSKPQNNNVLE